MNAQMLVEAITPELTIVSTEVAPLDLRTLDDAELIHVGGGNCVADY